MILLPGRRVDLIQDLICLLLLLLGHPRLLRRRIHARVGVGAVDRLKVRLKGLRVCRLQGRGDLRSAHAPGGATEVPSSRLLAVHAMQSSVGGWQAARGKTEGRRGCAQGGSTHLGGCVQAGITSSRQAIGRLQLSLLLQPCAPLLPRQRALCTGRRGRPGCRQLVLCCGRVGAGGARPRGALHASCIAGRQALHAVA